MTAFRASVAKHPILVFYLLAVALSWSYWLALLVSGDRVEPGSTATHLPGLVGPMLAAVIVTGIASGARGLRDLLRRALTIPAHPKAGLLLAVSPVLLGLAVFSLLLAGGATWPSLSAFADYPGLPAGRRLWVVFIAALVLNGYGEEVGWRGFALPHLASRLGPLRSTVAVAILWLIWHAPLFWLVANMHALLGPAFIGWAAGLVAGAFVLAALYFATQSILVVAVWHTLFNFVVATPPGRGVPAAIASTVVMLCGVVVAVYWWRREHAMTSRADLRR